MENDVPLLEKLGENAPEEGVSLAYLIDTSKYVHEKPYAIDFEIPLPDEKYRSNLGFESKKVYIRDLRAQKTQLSIAKHGFEITDIRTELDQKYFASCSQPKEMLGVAQILRETFGTKHVFCFSQIHRKAEGMTENIFVVQQPKDYSLPVNNPHADYTLESGAQRLHMHLTEEEYEKFTDGSWRTRIINFWKPTHNPVENHPLVFCDSRTVKMAQVVPCDLVSPGHVGGCSFLKHTNSHHWYWLSEQQTNEAFIFTSWDSHAPGEIPCRFNTNTDFQRSE
ncbi:hypothetical protein F5884DRAFT_786925 [Xylogone sp. PMI_703]|nr:hypothetical protein F5884DRAFT_786925 [Xylogone sp. PMI_703]